jgi:hypothetical protein
MPESWRSEGFDQRIRGGEIVTEKDLEAMESRVYRVLGKELVDCGSRCGGCERSRWTRIGATEDHAG